MSFVYIVYVYKSIFSSFYQVEVNIMQKKTCEVTYICLILTQSGSGYLLFMCSFKHHNIQQTKCTEMEQFHFCAKYQFLYVY